MIINFMDARGKDLIPGAIYKAGNGSSFAADPIRNLFPKLGNQSGFRKKLCEDSKGKSISNEWAYVALVTTGNVSEWPDKLDEKTRIFTYYGDQRDLSKDIFDTKQKGNVLLRDVFFWLHSRQYNKIPPFFIFQNIEGSRDTKFLGLAIPGNPSISENNDLQYAKDSSGKNVNNYLSYFTLLDIKDSHISFEWLKARITNKAESDVLAPKAWRDFTSYGLVGVPDTIPDEIIISSIEEELKDIPKNGEVRKALVNARVNQGVFRNRLLKRYHKCCLCEIQSPGLLTASHIKPWSECLPSEKLDADNGFLLCPNHDSLFDAGYISFKDDGSIMISDKLNKNDATVMNISSNMMIEVKEGNMKYLKYHRENVYLVK